MRVYCGTNFYQSESGSCWMKSLNYSKKDSSFRCAPFRMTFQLVQHRHDPAYIFIEFIRFRVKHGITTYPLNSGILDPQETA